MAKFAEIYNGSIANTVVADTLEDAQVACPAHALIVEVPAGVANNWTYDGTKFVAPVVLTEGA